jgi:hypothetical protein
LRDGIADRELAFDRRERAARVDIPYLQPRAARVAVERGGAAQAPGADVHARTQRCIPLHAAAEASRVVLGAAHRVVEQCRVDAVLPLRRIDRSAGGVFEHRVGDGDIELPGVGIVREARLRHLGGTVDALVTPDARQGREGREIEADLLQQRRRDARSGPGHARLRDEQDIALADARFIEPHLDPVKARQGDIAVGEGIQIGRAELRRLFWRIAEREESRIEMR